MLSDGGRLKCPVRRWEKFEAGIYFWMPRKNIAHCLPVGNVPLFDLNHDIIAALTVILVSDWTVALNTWNTTRDLDDKGRKEDMA